MELQQLAAADSGGITTSRDLLTDPRHGLLAILLERRRLFTAIPDNSNPTSQTQVPPSPGSDGCLTVASPADLEGRAMVLQGQHRLAVDETPPTTGSRRRASDPGPRLRSAGSSGPDQPADALVRRVARETLMELRQVSDRVLELCVTYLKNAAFSVVDSSVDEVKTLISTRL